MVPLALLLTEANITWYYFTCTVLYQVLPGNPKRKGAHGYKNRGSVLTGTEPYIYIHDSSAYYLELLSSFSVLLFFLIKHAATTDDDGHETTNNQPNFQN